MNIDINDYIIVEGNICEGKPIFRGTRIMVWQVLELLGAGVGINEIIENYFPQLNKEAIFSVLNYASKLIGQEKYVVFQ